MKIAIGYTDFLCWCNGILNASLAAASALSLCLFCSNPQVAGGTDVGNPGQVALIGYVVDTTGAPQDNTQIGLYPAGFNPLTDTPALVQRDTTDRTGKYTFENIDTGRYTIDAYHISKGTRQITENITVFGNDIVERTADTLRTPGVLTIRVPKEIVASATHLFIPGTSISVPLDTSGIIHIDSVPPGISNIMFYSTDTDSVIESDSTVQSDYTTLPDSLHSDSSAPNDTTINAGFSNFIFYDIAVDCTGTVWAGTRNGVLYSFNGSLWRGQFASFGGSNAIYAVAVAPDNVVWFSKADWAYRWDGTELIQRDISSSVSDIVIATDSSVWITGNGLTRYRDSVWEEHYIDSLQYHPIIEAHVHPSGGLWFNCENGLLSYVSGIWTHIDQNTGAPSHDATIFGILHDGTMWADVFPKDDSTWYTFDGDTWTPVIAGDDIPWLGRITDVIEDDRGTLWIASQDGIFRNHNGTWENLPTNKISSDDYASAITTDTSGNVWFALDGGVSMWDGRRWVNYR
jgi:hypothetical protein